MERRLTLLAAILALFLVGAAPLGVMLWKSVHVDGALSLSRYLKLIGEAGTLSPVLVRSLVLALSVTLVATVTGVALGVILGKTDLAWRKTLALLFCLPLVVPPYVLSLSWFAAVSEDSPLALLIPASVLQFFSGQLFALPGCIWVLSSALMPIVMILTMVYLRAVNPRVEEAARLSTGWINVLRHITVPMIFPSIVFSALLVFLLALGEVGVPMFLHLPVFAVETLTQIAAFYDFGAAMVTALPLLLVALILLALERRHLRDHLQMLTALTHSKEIALIPLGHIGPPVLAATIILAVIAVLLPFSMILTQSLAGSGYAEAWSHASASVWHSVLISTISACLLTALGFLLGYVVHHRIWPAWNAVDSVTLLLFILPGTVIGIGLIELWNRPSMNWIYGTSAMIVLACLAQYVALPCRITMGAMANVPSALEDAAQIVGAPWFARLRHVILPSIAPALVVAWAVSYVFCMRDLGASMLVYPPGSEPLAVLIFSIMANGKPAVVSALSVILIAATVMPLALLRLLVVRAGESR